MPGLAWAPPERIEDGIAGLGPKLLSTLAERVRRWCLRSTNSGDECSHSPWQHILKCPRCLHCDSKVAPHCCTCWAVCSSAASASHHGTYLCVCIECMRCHHHTASSGTPCVDRRLRASFIECALAANCWPIEAGQHREIASGEVRRSPLLGDHGV